jgi:uncharacterized protein YbaA (DUF1428 family)
MNYIDGFVLAVEDVNREKYQIFAQNVALLFKQNGALRVVESWASDVPEGKLTSFPMAVKLKPGESVVFSWVEWPSKAIRDTGMQIMMQDPIFDISKNPMPVDGSRMIFGSFETIVEV